MRDVLAETRAAAALNHPNVCTIFAVDDSEGVPVIAMEYVDGQPLNVLLQAGALSPLELPAGSSDRSRDVRRPPLGHRPRRP